MILYIISVPIGIIFAFYPGDIYPEIHDRLTFSYYLFILSSIFIFSLAMYFNQSHENYYATLGIVILLIALFHIFLVRNAFLQKITVYSLILWCLIQSVKLKKIND